MAICPIIKLISLSFSGFYFLKEVIFLLKSVDWSGNCEGLRSILVQNFHWSIKLSRFYLFKVMHEVGFWSFCGLWIEMLMMNGNNWFCNMHALGNSRWNYIIFISLNHFYSSLTAFKPWLFISWSWWEGNIGRSTWNVVSCWVEIDLLRIQVNWSCSTLHYVSFLNLSRQKSFRRSGVSHDSLLKSLLNSLLNSLFNRSIGGWCHWWRIADSINLMLRRWGSLKSDLDWILLPSRLNRHGISWLWGYLWCCGDWSLWNLFCKSLNLGLLSMSLNLNLRKW